MRLLTRDTRYSVRALTALADYMQERPDAVVTVDMLATTERIPRNYLRKLLQVLARNGILESHKGKHGGFTLRQKPEEITLADVIAIFQGTVDNMDCYTKGHICQRSGLCALRKKMAGINNLVKREFKKITIASLQKEKAREKP
jgi:Rrf2 family protein